MPKRTRPAVAWGTSTLQPTTPQNIRTLSSGLLRIPYQVSSAPLGSAYDRAASTFTAPLTGLYEVTITTTFAARGLGTTSLKTAYVYYFVNTLPVCASGQLVSGSLTNTTNSISSSQLFELQKGDVVYAIASLPDPTATSFLPNFLPDGTSSYIIFGSWLTAQFLDRQSRWFRVEDLKVAVPLTASPQVVPFAAVTGPLAESLDPTFFTFTAPMTGLYEAAATAGLFCNNATSVTAFVFLVVNGQPTWLVPQLVGGVGGVQSFVATSSLRQLVYLQEGDLVTFSASSPSGTPVQVFSQLTPSALQSQPLPLTWWTMQLLESSPSVSLPHAPCSVSPCTMQPLLPCTLPPPSCCAGTQRCCGKTRHCSLCTPPAPAAQPVAVQWFTATPPTSLVLSEEGDLCPFLCTGPLSASFDAATSLFHAPITGAYKMSATVSVSSIEATVSSIQLSFVVNDRGTYMSTALYGNATIVALQSSVTLLQILELTAGDTVYLNIARNPASACTLLNNMTLVGLATPVPVTWWTAILL